MAGFFDELFGSENEPDRRDYKRFDEITNPEEREAYRAGESATGSLIPGLDYARSMFRGAKREVTDPSMGPLGERYNEEMDRYRRRQEEFQRLQKLYPEAVRGGQLRGTEATPGAEAAFMVQPLAGAAARSLARGAMRSAPQMAEREAAVVPQAGGEWPSLDTYNPGRTNKWRERVFKDPSLNPTRSMAEEMSPGESVPEAPAAAPRPARVQAPAVKSHWERLADLPEATRNDLLLWRQTGQAPSGFRLNAIRSALSKRGLSLNDVLGPSEGTMNPSVYGAQTESMLSGTPMSRRQQGMFDTHMQTFRAPTEADIGTKRTIRSPLSSGMNEPDLQFSPTVNENIANRAAAQEAKNERFAKLPPVLQTNAFYKQANRLLEGADEAHDFMTQRIAGRAPFRNVAPDEVISGMSEASGYRPPEVVRRWNEKNTDLLPTRTQQAINRVSPILERIHYNPKVGAVGAGGGILGGMAAADKGGPPVFPLPDLYGQPKKNIPEWSPLAARMPAGAAGPSMAQMYGPETNQVIAETKREGAPRPAAAPVHRAPVREAPAHRAAPARRAAPSGERYYGDWRDTEPFASDPIGQFIDELTGQRKMSRSKGNRRSNEGGLNLGDLLPFEDGGVVRSHFADGGTDDEFRIPILSDIGDAIGGLFGEGRTVKASDSDEPSSNLRNANLDALGDLLLASGMGMMASPAHDPLRAIGEGGLKGLEYYQASRKNLQALREKEQERADKLRQLKTIENLDKPNVVSADEAPAPEPLETAAPKIEAPSVKPIKPAETETTAPEKVVAADEVKTPTTTVPAVSAAENAKLRDLEEKHRRAVQAIQTVTIPEYRSALEYRIKGLEYEIDKIRSARKDAIIEARTAAAEKRSEEAEKRLERQSSLPYIEEKIKVEEAAKNQDKIIQDTRSAAEKAKVTVGKIDQVLDAYKTGKIHTSPAVFNFLTGLQSLGYELSPSMTEKHGPDPEAIKNTETLASLGVSDLLKEIGGSLGHAISDADRAMIERMAVSVDKSPAANVERLKMLKKVMNRATEAREFMQKYLDERGRLDKDYQIALEKRFAGESLSGDEVSSKTSSPSASRSEDKIKDLLKRFPQYTEEQLIKMLENHPGAP